MCGIWLFSCLSTGKCTDGLILWITSLVSVQSEVLARLGVFPCLFSRKCYKCTMWTYLYTSNSAVPSSTALLPEAVSHPESGPWQLCCRPSTFLLHSQTPSANYTLSLHSSLLDTDGSDFWWKSQKAEEYFLSPLQFPLPCPESWMTGVIRVYIQQANIRTHNHILLYHLDSLQVSGRKSECTLGVFIPQSTARSPQERKQIKLKSKGEHHSHFKDTQYTDSDFQRVFPSAVSSPQGKHPQDQYTWKPHFKHNG